MSKLDEIMDSVAAEATVFRKDTQRLPGKAIYDKAYDICLVEELVYLVCENPDDYCEDEQILRVLHQLCAGPGFLPAFLDWAQSQDSVDISNIGRTYDTLVVFCEQQLEEDLEESDYESV